MSHFALVVILHKRGELTAAQEHGEKGLKLYRHYRNHPSAWQAHHFGVGCLNCLAWILWLLGYPDQARKRAQEALSMAQKMAQPMTQAEALGYLARFSQNLGERQAAEERANVMVTLCTEQGFPLWRAEGVIVQGWALVEQGHQEEGVAQVRQGLADYQATGAALILPDSLAMLAAIHLQKGEAAEGLEVVNDALREVEKTEGRLWEAELYRLKGELLLMQEGKKQREPNPSP
jgi:predicted ATPase